MRTTADSTFTLDVPPHHLRQLTRRNEGDAPWDAPSKHFLLIRARYEVPGTLCAQLYSRLRSTAAIPTPIAAAPSTVRIGCSAADV